MEKFDKKELDYNPPVIGWKSFRDDIFVVMASFCRRFFNYMNIIDRTKKIQFTLEVTENVLEFLDLKLTFGQECK